MTLKYSMKNLKTKTNFELNRMTKKQIEQAPHLDVATFDPL